MSEQRTYTSQEIAHNRIKTLGVSAALLIGAGLFALINYDASSAAGNCVPVPGMNLDKDPEVVAKLTPVVDDLERRALAAHDAKDMGTFQDLVGVLFIEAGPQLSTEPIC